MKVSETVETLLSPMPESSLPRNEWELRFLEGGTRNWVKEKGEDWVRRHRQLLLAELEYIWSV